MSKIAPKKKKKNATSPSKNPSWMHMDHGSFLSPDLVAKKRSPSNYSNNKLPSFPETSAYSQFKSISVSRYSYFSDRSSINSSLNSLTNQDLEHSDDSIPDVIQPLLTNGLKLSTSNDNLLLDPKYKAKKAVNFDVNDIKEQGIIYTEPITPKPNYNNNILPNSLSLNELLGNSSIKHNSAGSLTMSQSISLFTESEKRRNSANFYRVWGKKASLAKLTPKSQLSDSQKSIFELTKLEDEEWTDEEALSQTDSDEDMKDDNSINSNNNNDNNNDNSTNKASKHKKSRTLIMRRKTLTEQYTSGSSTENTILETRQSGSLNSISNHDD